MTAITRRSVLAGAPAVVAVAAIPALAAPQQDPIAELGRRWLAANKRLIHWSGVAAKFLRGSPEHKEPYRLRRKALDEMCEVEDMMIAERATTFAGLLARWEVVEWHSTYDESDTEAVVMRADLERLSGAGS